MLAHPAVGYFVSLTTLMATELLFATGVRIAELAGLRDDDIDLTAGVIIVGKGSRQRGGFVPDAKIREMIVVYRHARDARDHGTDAFLVNSRGGVASPQHLRRLVRQLGENAALTRRVPPTYSATP